MKKVDFSAFEKALLSLEEVLKLTKDDIIRDSAIQRFEYTVELAWKTLRRSLQEEFNVRVDHPKDILREGARLGYLNNLEEWHAFLEARNSTSHAYGAELADKVYQLLPNFANHARILLTNIKKYNT